MKFNQSKNIGKIFYLVFTINIIITSLLGITSLTNYGTIAHNSEKSERIFCGVFFLIVALIALSSCIYVKISKKFERTVEINKDGIVYYEKNKTIKMNWEDVAMVGLNPCFLFSPSNRVVFTAWGVEPYWKTSKVTNKRIWSEYNDEMLEEIKKCWHGRIVNEDKYLKYKNSSVNENREYE